MKREILFPTPMYWKDIPHAKELNKYLFKHIKAWYKQDIKKVDLQESLKLIQVLVGIVQLI